MVYKVKITKTYYIVRRGDKRYRYLKLIINLPTDEKLLNVDYVYVLTPEEYEELIKVIKAIGSDRLRDKVKLPKDIDESFTTTNGKSNNA